MPRGGGHAIGGPGKTPQTLNTLEETSAWQSAGTLADHQRTAQRLFGPGVQCRQILERGRQGLHGRGRQLQTFQQRPISQQMALAAGLIKLPQQPVPMLAADTYAHD